MGVPSTILHLPTSKVPNFHHVVTSSVKLLERPSTSGVAPSRIIGVEVSHLDSGYRGRKNTITSRSPAKVTSTSNHSG